MRAKSNAYISPYKFCQAPREHKPLQLDEEWKHLLFLLLVSLLIYQSRCLDYCNLQADNIALVTKVIGNFLTMNESKRF